MGIVLSMPGIELGEVKEGNQKEITVKLYI